MNTHKQVTVFGATGNVGKELLHFLSEAGVPTIAVTRDISKAQELPSVQWIAADMAKKETLTRAMEGSTAIFLASGLGEHFVQEQTNVVEAAKELGIGHIVKLSMNGAEYGSPFYIAQLNYETDEIVRASGISYTILQPHSFMQNWLRGDFANNIKTQRKIYEATGEGRKPFIDTRDIAEVAYTVLVSPAQHINQIYVLTADEAVSYGQVAEAFSKALGEPVAYVQLSSDELKSRLEQNGMPPFLIHTFIAIAEGQRNGKADFTTPAVRDILQKPARTVEGFARDYITYFK